MKAFLSVVFSFIAVGAAVYLINDWSVESPKTFEPVGDAKLEFIDQSAQRANGGQPEVLTDVVVLKVDDDGGLSGDERSAAPGGRIVRVPSNWRIKARFPTRGNRISENAVFLNTGTKFRIRINCDFYGAGGPVLRVHPNDRRTTSPRSVPSV